MKIMLFLFVSVCVGSVVAFNQQGNNRVDETRKELARLGAITNDEDFTFEFGKFLQMELGVQLPIRFGEWYPAAAGAQFQVLNDGSVLLRSKNDERIQVDETAVFFVGGDGAWHQDTANEHGIAATLTICKKAVILVNIEKGTTVRVVRIDRN